MFSSTWGEIRRARPDEAEAIRALVRRAYAKWIISVGREPMPMRADYVRALAEHEIWMIDGIHGGIALIELKPEPDHLLIVNVAVDPSHQGRGLGRRLLDFAEQEARQRGLPEIRLYTNIRMSENRALYAARGYRETHQEQRGEFTIVHMAKPVPA
ncbi:GNAT family N-acetyltransferase [Inquilinus limosus]|uniref:GNAT family N-acetyltransferase n=1 Tax=Inquilinus limosus TaxID=171674 RepID=UPI00041667C6|nr:GNAT family N-acetyltransferase [Inquilinus limosus]